MRKYHSLKTSEFIWNIVDVLLPKEISDNITLETFNNCREQGFVGVDWEKGIAVWTYAQRNSDAPTVIIGSTKNFANLNNLFDERAWQTSTSYKSTEEAAKAIVTALEKLYHA